MATLIRLTTEVGDLPTGAVYRLVEFERSIPEKQPSLQAAVLLVEAGRLTVDHYFKKV